ncbi:class I SAM-dependent methyltransferase [Staphylococcus edaphicus]|uniref:SAM-dependent methyltransferase n=1 Tax=Staphylococcus edaphicus TaxID=1955013 RepID=A0A2C6VIC9_9STAP|nr:class I SAM-dependent methyltransferase [Staphylococcus edaphicus]PHK49981.1 SAM-dependent methyltransferase [Staphylococcus edaphicus]UQW81758.1 class I SAM-dependent methyltransferase [Staphylococcus edaphicus]
MEKSKIINYWDKRADSFSKNKRAELKSTHAQKWITEISHITPIKPGMKVLDIGTGAGFLAILCSEQGGDVTGIDLSPDMIQSAKQNADRYNHDIHFQVMDAETLLFNDETFDLVISRNVTWLLPNTTLAYQEWLRVLKPNGTLINIDANYGQDSFTDYQSLNADHAHHTLGNNMLVESEAIKQSIPINHQPRPQTDIGILKHLGVNDIHLDTEIYLRIYSEQDAFYNPTPIFLISVTKS